MLIIHVNFSIGLSAEARRKQTMYMQERLTSSLKAALHREHDGLDYFEDLMVPLVEYLHKESGLFEDTDLLPGLKPTKLIRDTIAAKRQKNSDNKSDSSDPDDRVRGRIDSQAYRNMEDDQHDAEKKKMEEKLGSWPAFSMYDIPDANTNTNKYEQPQLSKRSLDLVDSCKAAMYRDHVDQNENKDLGKDDALNVLMSEGTKRRNARLVQRWMAAVMCYHEQLFSALNMSAQDEMDVGRLLKMFRPSTTPASSDDFDNAAIKSLSISLISGSLCWLSLIHI